MLLDAPPLLAVGDGLTIAGFADALVVVVRSEPRGAAVGELAATLARFPQSSSASSSPARNRADEGYGYGCPWLRRDTRARRGASGDRGDPQPSDASWPDARRAGGPRGHRRGTHTRDPRATPHEDPSSRLAGAPLLAHRRCRRPARRILPAEVVFAGTRPAARFRVETLLFRDAAPLGADRPPLRAVQPR